MTNDSKRPVVVKDAPTTANTVTIRRQDLNWAAREGLIDESQVQDLWAGLASKFAVQPKFTFANVAAYSGAVLVLIAMGAIMALFASDPQSMLAISAIYTVIFGGTGYYFSRDKQQMVPGGLLTTLAVSMTPIVGISWMSMYGGVDLATNQQIILEVATILAGVVALQFVRFPFITAPIYASLWFMAMTVTNSFSSGLFFFDYDNLVVSMVFGALVSVIAFVVDKRTKEDFSFWGYFFGLLMLWGAWSFMATEHFGEAGRFIYFLSNLAMMAASVVLSRKIFLVFGTFGAIGYLFYLTWELFANSMLFPFALLGMGCLVIYGAVLYRRHGARLETALLKAIGQK